MPPVFFALAAAAGFFAAARAISAMMGHSTPDEMTTTQHAKHAAASDSARNLGQLEWDASSGVYRPKSSS